MTSPPNALLPTEEQKEAANDLTVELTEAMLMELDVDEDDPRLKRWGEIADEKIAAAFAMRALAKPDEGAR